MDRFVAIVLINTIIKRSCILISVNTHTHNTCNIEGKIRTTQLDYFTCNSSSTGVPKGLLLILFSRVYTAPEEQRWTTVSRFNSDSTCNRVQYRVVLNKCLQTKTILSYGCHQLILFYSPTLFYPPTILLGFEVSTLGAVGSLLVCVQ